MQIQVRCRCAVARTIDTSTVGSFRLRCKTCGDIIYDPQAAAQAAAEAAARDAQKQGRKPPPQPLRVETTDEENSQFQDWLQGSAELKVMLSNETDPSQAQNCAKHPSYKIVAACVRCEKLLCKRCLDRVGDSFTCAECIEKQLLGSAESGGGGFFGFFKRLFGGGKKKKAAPPPPKKSSKKR